VDLLNETDRFRQMGGYELAEKQYLDMVRMLRQAQGPSTSDVALMLDHLGEFYLEERNFDRAYEIFSVALQVRRSTIDALNKAQ